MSAEVSVLVEGYADDRVAGTVTLIRDGDVVIVVDPGMVADRGLILDPLTALGIHADAVTDVVFSHHHLDHTLHAALFPQARFHDFQGSTAVTSGRTARPRVSPSGRTRRCSRPADTPTRTSRRSCRPTPVSLC